MQRRWWHAVEIQRHLRLTATQVARLDALFERELPQRIQRHRQIQDLDRHLAHVIEHDTGDDNHVAHLSEQVEALRAAQNIHPTLMLFTMYQTLTQEHARCSCTCIARAAPRARTSVAQAATRVFSRGKNTGTSG